MAPFWGATFHAKRRVHWAVSVCHPAGFWAIYGEWVKLLRQAACTTYQTSSPDDTHHPQAVLLLLSAVGFWLSHLGYEKAGVAVAIAT